MCRYGPAGMFKARMISVTAEQQVMLGADSDQNKAKVPIQQRMSKARRPHHAGGHRLSRHWTATAASKQFQISQLARWAWLTLDSNSCTENTSDMPGPTMGQGPPTLLPDWTSSRKVPRRNKNTELLEQEVGSLSLEIES